MLTSTKAIRFLESLKAPEGPLSGNKLKLAPFQKKFVKGALEPSINVAVLSVGRGAAKTAISAGLGVAALLGIIDGQPRREIVIAARNRDQGRIAFRFCEAFVSQLIEDGTLEASDLRTRKGNGPLEIEWTGDGGGHFIRVIAADGKSALGGSPVIVLMDERGHWEDAKGDDLEHALLSGLGKRGGRALIISTSAASDAHPFSVWLDQEQEGVYRQEHRPPPGLPADDLDSLKEANPGAELGIGSSREWLQAPARRAIARGGSTLTSFRLYNRNERVSAETRDVLLTVDEWLACETADANTLASALPACSIDLIVTDPPYGVNYRDRTGRRVRNDDTLDHVLPVFEKAYRALKGGGICVSFYGWNRIDRFMSAWKSTATKPRRSPSASK